MTGDYTMKIETDIEYDRDRGLVTMTDQFTSRAIEVRAKLEDDFLRQAVIVELERLGYTVISPEGRSA